MSGPPDPDGGPARGERAEGAGTRPDPRAAGAGARVTLSGFVARLRQAGLDPDVRQVCDALWLAGQLTEGPGHTPDTPSCEDRDADGAREGENRVDGVTGDAGDGNTAPVNGTPHDPDRPPADPRIALGASRSAPGDGPRSGHGPGTYGRGRGAGGASARGGGRSLPIGVPSASALPGTLQLQRALRPLQRYRGPNAPVETTLDEAATADLSARAGGLVVPVYRASTRAEVDLQLVMDVSSSMLVWQRLLIELEDIFSHLGAFRDVRVRYLHQGPDGEPAVSTHLDPRAAALGPAERLSDPTGSRITVLVSDCAGPLWYSGQAHRLLHRLSRQAPVAVLQPLPQRLWGRTGLPVTYGVLARGEGAGSAALRLVGRGAPARA
ncbi:SAV_2336 N-terminal domain-related protein, partial [Streptomyces fuscigenes]|uniref:SAV_2336 N-terminal domain-related protein n=1 Tax=Streptomyces fuscigenes TaxID=1528880 RepID=UPI0022A85162